MRAHGGERLLAPDGRSKDMVIRMEGFLHSAASSILTLLSLLSPVSAGVLGVLRLATGAAAQGAQESDREAGEAQDEGRMRHQLPVSGGRRAEPIRGLLEGKFEPIRWSSRLSVPDLDQRERYFEVLLSRARLDPLARGFLEELARGRNELAWTARLALRELRAPRATVAGPGLDSGAYQRRFAEAYQRLLAEHPEMAFMVPGGPATSFAEGGGFKAVVLLDVHLVQDESGAFIEVTGEGPRGSLQRRFEGKNLDEIFAAQPELQRQIQVEAGSLPDTLDLRLVVPAEVPLGQAGGGRTDPPRRPKGAAGPSSADDVESHFAPNELVPVRTDVLGVVVEPVGPEESELLGIDVGLRVLRLEPGTIADRMGLRTGDVLLSFDGAPLRRPQDITDAMEGRKREDPLTLLWLDDLNTPIRGVWSPHPKKGGSREE